jgi:hypothetical protein
MSTPVAVSFECTPLRSIARWGVSPDVTPDQQEALARLRKAAQRHGLHNSYYLSSGHCEFHLTNDPQVGLLAFRFEGTVLTDPHDRRTRALDLHVELAAEVCEWLTASAVRWFRETVVQAVRVEFDRYIDSGDLEAARQRLARIEAEMADGGGFAGMGV